ncbi:MAG TPA: pilus assembly PilX N-terminal domain-containing protein [Planctomycetota bacterium]|nr:pilus assembly PilX N-terminal domain-containing protein [Planctomycetota bacterium]
MVLSTTIHPERGGALISALIAITVIATMALGISTVTMTSNGVIVDTEDRMHALMLAETGVALAFKKIDQVGATAFENWPEDTPFLEEYIHGNDVDTAHRYIQVYKKKNSANRPMLRSIGAVEKKVIVGNVTRVRREVEATIGWQSRTGEFPSGAFGMSSLEVGGNFGTDSYDASVGAYDPASAGFLGHVGTNGGITIKGNSFYVRGDARPGPGQAPVSHPNITGSGAPLLEPYRISIPQYRVPSGASRSQSLSLSGPYDPNLNAAAYHWTDMITRNQDTITVQGRVDLYVDETIDIKGDLRLADQNSVLNVYHKSGTVTINGGGESNSGIVEVIPAYTIEHPAETVNHPSATRTVAASTDNQAPPPTYEHEGQPIPTYKTIKVKGKSQTVVDYWTINREAYTEVIPAWTENVPEQRITRDGGLPSNFNIISQTSDAVKMNGNSRFFGTIVAPNAEVTINGNADKYGAVLGKTMVLLGTGKFHNDTSARSPGISRKAMLLSIRELPVSE